MALLKVLVLVVALLVVVGPMISGFFVAMKELFPFVTILSAFAFMFYVVPTVIMGLPFYVGLIGGGLLFGGVALSVITKKEEV